MEKVPEDFKFPDGVFFEQDFPSSKLSTFEIGGIVDFVAWPENCNQIISLKKWAKEKKLPVYISGGGSNILFSDKGLRGLLIVTSKMTHFDFVSDILETQSGVSVVSLVEEAASRGISGLEFAAGLPGLVGGAVFMNARAYGSEFSEIISEVEFVDENLNVSMINNENMDFLYKHSVFQENNGLITKVFMKLKKGDPDRIKDLSLKNRNDRIMKKQDKIKSAGCAFKNNYDAGIPSGKLIEDAGLKGFQIGDAEIFSEHANFIINKGDAKAKDVLDLIKLAQKKVFEKFKIRIEPEIEMFGDFD